MTGINIMHQSKSVNALEHLPYALATDSIVPMQKRTVHAILAELMTAKGTSQTDLHRATGVPQSTISRILKGTIADPADKHIAAIASYFGISTDQMRGRSAPTAVAMRAYEQPGVTHMTPVIRSTVGTYEPEAELDGPIEEWSDETPIPDDVVALPFLKEVELSAGSGRTAVEVATNRRLRFGKYSLRSQNVQADHAVAVTVYGNSMEPVMPGGTTVAVNRADTRIVDGKTYAIDHGGQLRVKLLYRLPGGGIRVRSHNRDEHPDEDYTDEQVQTQGLSVIGRVFWVGMYL